MWIVKGVSLGLVIFVVGSIALSILSVMAGYTKIEMSHATGLGAVAAETIFNPMFWIALISCMTVGCALFKFRKT